MPDRPNGERPSAHVPASSSTGARPSCPRCAVVRWTTGKPANGQRYLLGDQSSHQLVVVEAADAVVDALNLEARRRFVLVAAPAAPWVLAAGATGFAVVPAAIPGLGDGWLACATAEAAITLGRSVLIQPLALGTVTSARSLFTGTLVALIGLATVLAAILAEAPALGLVASATLGCAKGY